MLVDKLLEHFDAYTNLHIDVNDVRDQLVSMGVQDEINFHFVNMDANRIRGIIYRYTRRPGVYAEPIFCTDIVIAKDMGEEDEAWKRLVAVKELLHIADCPALTAESEAATQILFKNFSVPPELRTEMISAEDNTRSWMNDRIRIYLALAILVPKACREMLREVYGSKLSGREIADIARIPERYVDIVMGNEFEQVIETFLEFERAHQ